MEGCRESLAVWRCALVERKAAGEKGRESETSASEVRVSGIAGMPRDQHLFHS